MENISLKDNLLPNEQILAEGKTHWMRIVAETLLYTGVMFVLIGLLGSIFKHSDFIDDAGPNIVVIVAIISLIISTLKYLREELFITNMRVVRTRGLLYKSRIELNIDQTESFAISQSIIGRTLNYGHIRIGGTGRTLISVFFVKSPYTFCSSFSDIKYNAERCKK